MGVGRNYKTLPAVILKYPSRLVHIHTSDHTRTPVVSTMHLTFLKNLTNRVNNGILIIKNVSQDLTFGGKGVSTNINIKGVNTQIRPLQ